MDDSIERGIAATLSRRPEVDYLLVADRAEVVNGKLYLMGGGWDRYAPTSFPARLTLGVAVGLRVPFLHAEEPHHLVVVLEGDQARQLLHLEARITTGQPAGPPGMDILVPIAFNGAIQLRQPGTYVLKASVDGRESKRHEISAQPRGG